MFYERRFNPIKKCSVSKCDSDIYAKNLCRYHYEKQRNKKHEK